LILWGWLAALNDFRNWVTLGFQPAKRNENLSSRHNGGSVSGEIDLTSGAIEAEQLSGPERA
jgi:hypothetical protein